MNDLNFKHLRYFHAVAHERHLTRTAERLNISQSALSMQIKTLEERLGHALFQRQGRSLQLTEVGHIALDYADRIFATGNELMAVLGQEGGLKSPLRVGALSTLSRNFQLQFLRPVLGRDDVELALRSGNARRLLDELRALSLDLVLTTEPPRSDDTDGLIAREVADHPVALHAVPALLQHDTLADLLSAERVILPSEAPIRAGFETLTSQLDIRAEVIADVDDMAMIRLLAREGVGIALAPSIVFADELESGLLVTAPFDLGLSEKFYAITAQRNFPHPLLGELLG